MDTVTREVAKLGGRTLLGKMDVKSAYRIVPVNPEECLLLGVQWGRRTYLDTTLLHAVLIIFTALADALE